MKPEAETCNVDRATLDIDAVYAFLHDMAFHLSTVGIGLKGREYARKKVDESHGERTGADCRIADFDINEFAQQLHPLF